MIELYLSTDGKHTVHVQAATAQEAERLLPDAFKLYGSVVDKLGTKPALWDSFMNGNRGRRAKSQGSRSEGQETEAPFCKVHGTPMKLRRGPRGDFWSCPQRDERGEWCRETIDA